MKKLIISTLAVLALSASAQIYCIESREPKSSGLDPLKFDNYLRGSLPPDVLKLWCQVDNRWNPYGWSVNTIYALRKLTFNRPPPLQPVVTWESMWLNSGQCEVFNMERPKCSQFSSIQVEVMVYNANTPFQLLEHAAHIHY